LHSVINRFRKPANRESNSPNLRGSIAPKRQSREGGPSEGIVCSVHRARSAKGWTPERRARQAERIRLAQPWKHSTGPKTEAGKARVAMNGLRHGYRGRAWLERACRIRHAIRLCADTVLLARIHWLRQYHATATQNIGSPARALLPTRHFKDERSA
jgi:hypothetical protein